jgi:predicted kinase
MMNKGKLTFFCGKMGAGKSTKSIELSQGSDTVLLSEDELLTSLYPNQIKTFADYLKLSKQLKPQLKKIAQSILLSGTNVVLDFPANTHNQRQWFKALCNEIEAIHELIYIDLSDEACLKQIEQRRAQQPERLNTDTKAMFEQTTAYFQAPDIDEGLNITLISASKV